MPSPPRRRSTSPGALRPNRCAAAGWIRRAPRSPATRAGRRSGTGPLASALRALRDEIVGERDLAQLPRVALDRSEPREEALLAAQLGGKRQRAEEGLDGEVVAHRVALGHATHARDVTRRAVRQFPHYREAHLVAPRRGEVHLHGEPGHPPL